MDKPGFVLITGKIMSIGIIVLFIVFIFVLCLHLYAKCFWWRIEEQQQPTTTQRRRFVFAPSQRSTKGLDSTILASLPALIFNQNEFKDGLECAVCLCEVVEGEKTRQLPKCNHGFHVECIDMWFQSHSTCPLCRNPIVGGVEFEDSNRVVSSDEVSVQVSIQSPNDGYSIDSPSFPTNVLFWGNHGQVSSGTSGLEDGASLASSSSGTSGFEDGASLASSSSGRQQDDDDVLVNVNESEEESKSLPLPTRLRSLKRLLSREKRFVMYGANTNPC